MALKSSVRRTNAKRLRKTQRGGAARPVGIRGSRGTTTRDAFVEAGIRVFGRDGYLAATTKAIGREARANPALISYYFGGKEGLYRVVVERIVEEIGARIGPAAAEAEAALRAMDASAAAARQAYLELLFKLLDRFVEVLSSDESAAWARIIVREQQEPSPAFDLLYDRLQGRLLAQLAVLVARVRGHATPTANDRVIVLTIIGQALILRVARATALRFTGWGRLDARQTARIKNVLRRTVAASLTEAGRDA